MLSISFDVESREYNGRWYTDVKAWRIEAAGAANQNTDVADSPSFNNYDDEPKEDLPF